MARSRSFPLSSMNKGLNRYVREAGENQTVEAEDVVADERELRRRDAFAAFTHGYPHMLPAGQVTVKIYQYTGGTWWGDYANRTINSASKQSFGTTGSSGKYRLFIGCDTQFQGFHWAQYINGPNSDTSPHYIRIRFVTKDWTDTAYPETDENTYDQSDSAKWVGDSTAYAQGDLFDNAGEVQPLSRDGFIYWHKNSQPSAWDTKRTVDGVSAYWIIVDMATFPQFNNFVSDTDFVSEWPSTSANFQLDDPGIRCFTLQPITGLYSFHNRLDPQLLIAATPEIPRGQETGGPQLGSYEVNKPVNRVGLLKDEGSGFEGTYDTSGWTDTGWTGGSAGPGTSGELQKLDQSYDWDKARVNASTVLHYMGSWGYPILQNSITPLAGVTTTSMSFTLANTTDTEFEDCVFLCLDNGTSSVTEGSINRVSTSTVSGNTVSVTFKEAWNATPDTSATFMIFGIPHYCRLEADDSHHNVDATYYNTSPAEFEIFLTDTSDAHTIRLTPTKPDNSTFIGDRYDPANYEFKDGPVHFRICKEARYELPQNTYPDYTFDEVTRQYVFAFGPYPLQKFDGRDMRVLRALSDEDDLVVQAWTGYVRDKVTGDEEDPSFIAAATLRSSPPPGKFVQFFANRLFIAGIAGDPARVVYSAPGSYNDIWPKGFETMVRDPNGSPITGLSVLNDELVAFTPTSIFAAPPPDENGYTSMTARSYGVGFINNNVVQRAVIGGAAVLLGANADGIYAYTGAEPRIVLDEWDRLIPGGVNTSSMDRACATVSYYENAYYLAVPSSNSKYPDKLIRYCWEDKTMYVWNAPFGGVTAMTAVRDEAGNEQLVFGHEDGTVSELRPNFTDDGETITGKARTALFTSGGTTMAVQGYMVTVEDTGGSSYSTIDIVEYKDEDEGSSNTLYSGSFDGGTAEVNSFTLDTDSIGGQRSKKVTRRVHAKSGTRAETVQLEISGTGKWKLRGIEILLKGLGKRSQ